MSTPLKGFRGQILHFLDDPKHTATPEQSYEYWSDGLLIIDQGKIIAVGESTVLLTDYADSSITITHYKDQLILPGFIDCHVHYPQLPMIAGYGESLMQWLERYTFPVEAQFHDMNHAQMVAKFFIQQLLSHGTTTASVYCTLHPESVNALFTEAQHYQLRMIAGKVMMDKNSPTNLIETAETSYAQSQALIEHWHGQDRLAYAITPRFAPTSSERLLQLAGQLSQEYPKCYVQTHLAEDLQEISQVKQQFPKSKHYTGVYSDYGLLHSKTLLGHGIHLHTEEWQLIAETEAKLIHCPTSNLFLGSGLFSLSNAQYYQITTGLGTDIGGGTSLSLLSTLAEAYKIQRLQGYSLDPLSSFYWATLGGAKALSIDNYIGNFVIGKEADFTVINLNGSELQRFRQNFSKNIVEQLFVLSQLGNEQNIEATYSLGQQVYQRNNNNNDC